MRVLVSEPKSAELTQSHLEPHPRPHCFGQGGQIRTKASIPNEYCWHVGLLLHHHRLIGFIRLN